MNIDLSTLHVAEIGLLALTLRSYHTPPGDHLTILQAMAAKDLVTIQPGIDGSYVAHATPAAKAAFKDAIRYQATCVRTDQRTQMP